MVLVSTGIQGLDAHFGGGIPAGSTLLALSEPSNAPAAFSAQFVAAGLNAGETVYWYNLERPKDEVVAALQALAPKPEAIKHLQYLDCYAAKMKDLPAAQLKRMGVDGSGVKVLEDLPARLLAHPAGTPGRVVLESLTEILEIYGRDAGMAMFKSLSALVRNMKGVALVHAVKGMGDHGTETRMKHLADGVIEFGIERQGFGLYTYMSITKMRGVQDPVRLLLYKETEKGLWLESTRRVF